MAWGQVRLYRSDGSEFHILPSEIVASESLWTYGVYGGVPFELTGIDDADRQPVHHPVALSVPRCTLEEYRVQVRWTTGEPSRPSENQLTRYGQTP